MKCTSAYSRHRNIQFELHNRTFGLQFNKDQNCVRVDFSLISQKSNFSGVRLRPEKNRGFKVLSLFEKKVFVFVFVSLDQILKESNAQI